MARVSGKSPVLDYAVNLAIAILFKPKYRSQKSVEIRACFFGTHAADRRENSSLQAGENRWALIG